MEWTPWRVKAICTVPPSVLRDDESGPSGFSGKRARGR